MLKHLKKGQLLILIITLLFVGLCIFIEVAYTVHYLIYSLTFYALLNFMVSIDKKLALPELIGLITFIMYLLAPALMFDVNARQYIKPESVVYEILAINPMAYYKYAIPATVLFYGVIVFAFAKYRGKVYILSVFDKVKQRYDVTKVILVLIPIALVSNLLLNQIKLIDHLFYLGSQLTIIILMLSLLLKSKKAKILVFIAVTALLVINTIQTGMFSNLVFSLLFYALFYVLIYGMPMTLKVVLPLVAFFMLIQLEMFKTYYRKEIWHTEQDVGKTEKAVQVAQKMYNNFGKDLMIVSSINTLIRLNMAWHCSRAIKNVPAEEPYAYGKTIADAFLMLVPRVFWPDKPQLSGVIFIEKYGKHTPKPGISMSIGQIGESYVNFGRWGGILFYGAYGLLAAWILFFLIKQTSKNGIFIFFIPYVMITIVKPEVIFSKVFNTAFKGILFAYFIMILINYFCKHKNLDSKTKDHTV